MYDHIHHVCAGLLGRSNSLTSQEIIASDVLSAMVTLLASTQHKRPRNATKKTFYHPSC